MLKVINVIYLFIFSREWKQIETWKVLEKTWLSFRLGEAKWQHCPTRCMRVTWSSRSTVIETEMAKCAFEEQRVIIRFLHLCGMKPIKIHQQLSETCIDGVKDVKNVRSWVRQFKEGRTSCENNPKEPRPKKAAAVLFHQDNAPPHRAARVHQFFDDNNFEVVPHAPYLPDLAPSDFWLFPTLKDTLRGRTFSSRSAVATAILQWSERTPKEAFAAAMQPWRERCEKCVRLQGDYVEKWLHFQLPVMSGFFKQIRRPQNLNAPRIYNV